MISAVEFENNGDLGEQKNLLSSNSIEFNLLEQLEESHSNDSNKNEKAR